MDSYVVRRYRVPAGWHDRLCAELMAPGLLGIESRDDEIHAYYRPAGEPRLGLGAEWTERGVRLVERAEKVEEDWFESYRARAQPLALGERFWVDLAEPAGGPPDAAPPGRVLLRLPARRAFGTGSHESTRLAVAWLEELEPSIRGGSVLDLGSGSGVLTFVCEHLGARQVVGVESDPTAAMLGGRNRELNASRAGLVAGSLDALVVAPAFDCIVANILWVRLEPLISELALRLRDGGVIVVSGALASESVAAESAFRRQGLERRGARRDGEWLAWCLAGAGR